jgi:hypothetical protein
MGSPDESRPTPTTSGTRSEAPRNAEESSYSDTMAAPETEQPYYTSRSQQTVPISEGSEMR